MSLRVFFDSNVLVSALAFDGLERRLFVESRRLGVIPVVSDDVLREARRVLHLKFSGRVPPVFEPLEPWFDEVVPRVQYLPLQAAQSVRDARDSHVLAAAQAAHCPVIVTGDDDLLVLQLPGVECLTTRELLTRLKA